MPATLGTQRLGLENEMMSRARSSHNDTEQPASRPQILEQSQPIPPRLSTLRWALVCVGIFLGALLYGLDTTIAASVQGSIYESLPEIDKLPWVGIGFPMGSVAVILLVGKLYGMFEIKGLLISSIITFEIGSALCGAAPNANTLIVGRVIAGIGGAGMYIGALTYISVFTIMKQRAIYNGMIGFAWGLGAILGPVIAGAFASSKHTSWRWAFFINLPLAGVTSPIYFLAVPRYNPRPDHPTLTKLLVIDWLGALLNAFTFVIFMVVVSFSGSTFTWSSASSIVLWILFGISLILYILQQYFRFTTTGVNQLFPAFFLTSYTFILLYVATAAASASLNVCLYYIPLFFQFTRGDSALEAAVRLLPFIVLFVVSVMTSGVLLPRFGYYAPWYFPAGALILVGAVLMNNVTVDTHPTTIYGAEVLLAVGIGIIFQSAYFVTAVKVIPSEVSNTIGFINVAQIGSIAMGLSIAAALFQNLGYQNLRSALSAYAFNEEDLRSQLAGIESTEVFVAGSVVRHISIAAIVKTMGQIYYMVIAAGVTVLLCAFQMKRPWEKWQVIH